MEQKLFQQLKPREIQKALYPWSLPLGISLGNWWGQWKNTTLLKALSYFFKCWKSTLRLFFFFKLNVVDVILIPETFIHSCLAKWGYFSPGFRDSTVKSRWRGGRTDPYSLCTSLWSKESRPGRETEPSCIRHLNSGCPQIPKCLPHHFSPLQTIVLKIYNFVWEPQRK